MKPEYVYMNVVAPSFIIIPTVTALLRYKVLQKEVKILLLYLVVESIIIFLSSALAYYHLRNMPLYHVATIIETVLLLYFFSIILKTTYTVRFIKWAMIIFPVLSIINSLFIQSVYEFNSYPISLQFILMIFLCFLYWWQKENDESRPWGTFPLNWIICGFLLYFSSAFILFTFSNAGLVYLSRSNFILVWNVHATLSIIMYLMISIGIYKYNA